MYVTLTFSSRKARWQIPYNNKTVNRFGSGVVNARACSVTGFAWKLFVGVRSILGLRSELVMVIMRFRLAGRFSLVT
jgi:hypothetical protein